MEDTLPTQPKLTPPSAPAVDDAIDLFCPSCGYDLRGLETDACPECGAEVDLAKLRESSIPWVLAEGFWGHMKGFWRTCERVTFKPERFSREVARPVSLVEARRYRRVVVGVVWLTLVATAALDWVFIVGLKGQADDWGDFFREARISQAGLYVTLAMLLLLFLVGLTGLHLFAMHPRGITIERQNRAVAIGHYACAPLTALPFILALRAAGVLLAWAGEATHSDWANLLGMAAWFVTWLLGFAVLFWYLATVLTFTRRSAQRSGLAQTGLALGLPLLWLLWAILVFAALPAGALFVYLFFLTR